VLGPRFVHGVGGYFRRSTADECVCFHANGIYFHFKIQKSGGEIKNYYRNKTDAVLSMVIAGQRPVVHHVTPISNSPLSNLSTSLFLNKLKTHLFQFPFPP